jgi:N-acylneuraminate cytidylyltransferase
MVNKNNLAIIPARGGSKRIPKKNIKDFLGKPVIAYSIEAALRSGLFEEVMVSTDDKEIAETAMKYGAKVPFFRSSETSNDFAPLNDVLKEVVSEYKKRGREFDLICLMLPTAPLITLDNLRKGYELINNSGFDSVRPVVRFGFPIQRSFRLNEDNSVEPIFPEEFPKRSQDLEPAFHDSGQFYWIKGDKDLSSNKGAFEIPETEVQDIDNETDWKLAELKFKLMFDE